MTDNVIRREVQRRDDPFGIPACFYWTMDEVADWVDSIGYGKYKENFRSHFINGRKLLTVDACVLPRMGITHFGDILGLSKHIREVLGVRRHLRGYNPWQPRADYMSTRPTSGKKHPQFTYRQLANKAEDIVQARLDYFKKRNICYIGWSMEKYWDRQLRQEEKLMREQYRLAGIPIEDGSRKLIGSSMQERLRIAAARLLSYEDEFDQWRPGPDLPTREQMARVRNPSLLEPSPRSGLDQVLGQVNWSPVRGVPYKGSLGEVKWGEAEESRGGGSPPEPGIEGDKPQKKRVDDSRPTQQNEGVVKVEVPGSGKTTVAVVVQAPSVATVQGSSIKQKISQDEKNFETQPKDPRDVKIGEKSNGNTAKNKIKSNVTPNRGGRSGEKKRERPKTSSSRKNGSGKGNETTEPPKGREAQPYRVAAIFHWKKMDTSSGYPPLRLDKLKKCGYYYGEPA